MLKSFTNRTITNLSVDSRTSFPDCGQGAVRGLILLASPTSKKWMVRYKSPTDRTPSGEKVSRKTIIGDFQTMDVSAARSAALKIISQVDCGIDPIQRDKDKMSATTVAELWEDQYSRHHLSMKKETTKYEVTRQWDNDIKKQIGHLSLELLSETQVMGIVHKKQVSSPVMASRLFATLRHFFGWSRSNGFISVNPIRDLKFSNNARPRDRYLTAEEVKTFYLSLEITTIGKPTKSILKLLLLTGQRVSEVAGVRISEIDWDKRIWTIPKERVKNARQHVVPLSNIAFSLLCDAKADVEKSSGNCEGYLFPAFSRKGGGLISGPIQAATISRALAKEKNQVAMGFIDNVFTPHDLRRTAATHMNMIGVQPHTVEYILNHVSGSRAGVAGVYNRALPLDEMRLGLARWEQEVIRILEEREDNNVVQLHG